MDKFWNALMESTILQGSLALLFASTACYMWIVGRDVPETLIALLGLILGFYFRSKASVEVKKGLGYTPPTLEVTE